MYLHCVGDVQVNLINEKREQVINKSAIRA